MRFLSEVTVFLKLVTSYSYNRRKQGVGIRPEAPHS